MKIEEIDARIKELGRLLNSDNVERQQKGAFSEASEEVKKAYRQNLSTCRQNKTHCLI